MSKQRPITVDEAPVPSGSTPPGPPSRGGESYAEVAGLTPIGECVGKMIDCPTCGKPAMVQNARGARTQTQVLSSKWWVMVKCSGFCGSVLRRVAELVTVRPVPEPEPVIKALGACVGQFVKCPRSFLRDMGTALERTEICGAKSRAAWTLDEGHIVDCPQCQIQPYPGDTLVEVIG
jgi:hypothetical protein